MSERMNSNNILTKLIKVKAARNRVEIAKNFELLTEQRFEA